MAQRRQTRLFVCTTIPVLAMFLAGCGNGAAGEGWITLYDGKTLTGWNTRHADGANLWQAATDVAVDPADPKKFVITPGEGILVNGPAGKTTDVLTAEEFGDCEVHIEFVVPEKSNSGVYFMGRYEVQVFDSYGKEKETPADCGGIYARWINGQEADGHAPRINACKPPGKWQWFDVEFRAPRFDAGGKKVENARFVSVRHNGEIIHENVSLNGPTRAGMEPEQPRGPLLLQGDHGPVAYRNIRIKPLDKK